MYCVMYCGYSTWIYVDKVHVIVIYNCIVDILCVLVINCVSYKCIGHVPWIYYMYLS